MGVGLLTPGLWDYEVRWGKLCFSIKSFVFMVSLYLLYHLSITTPLSSFSGHHCYVYKLLLLDYGVSLLGSLFLSFLIEYETRGCISASMISLVTSNIFFVR